MRSETEANQHGACGEQRNVGRENVTDWWMVIVIVFVCVGLMTLGWVVRAAWETLKDMRRRDREYEKARKHFEEQLERVSANSWEARKDWTGGNE